MQQVQISPTDVYFILILMFKRNDLCAAKSIKSFSSEHSLLVGCRLKLCIYVSMSSPSCKHPPQFMFPVLFCNVCTSCCPLLLNSASVSPLSEALTCSLSTVLIEMMKSNRDQSCRVNLSFCFICSCM